MVLKLCQTKRNIDETPEKSNENNNGDDSPKNA